MNTKQATVSVPLAGLRFLYRAPRSRKIVCELDFDALKKLNPNTLDEFITEARLEYFAGETRCFRDPKKLIQFLNA